MSLRTTFLALGVVLAAAAAPAALAQGYYGDSQPIRWHVMGGIQDPVGTAGDLLSTGWNLGFGVTFRQPGSRFGIRADFVYGTSNANSNGVYQASGATDLNITGGWVNVWSGTVDAEFRQPFSDTVHGYLLGGIGVYYTSVQLTEVGYGYVCNPWWGYCYVGTGNAVVASNSSTRFGWNAGAGVSFKLGSGQELFVEARYTWIETSSQTLSVIPIVIGVRF